MLQAFFYKLFSCLMVYRVMMNRLVMTMMNRVMGLVVYRMMILSHRKPGHGKKNNRSQ